MAAIFTAKDLEVYKDSLKEKKTRTSKTADKPPLRTPPSVAKVSKPPPLKLNNEEPLKERKPLSVVHKASNTIKDPHIPSSPTPVGSSKQADQWRRTKETTLKSPPAGKIRITDVNPLVKASEYKSDSLKSPREALPSKSSHIKSDDSKASGARKSSTQASPVYHKSPSLSGAKATPTVDVNASLCSECIRSASEGAVCFIGNDGRVSACTTRSAVRLCKNLNCAANNPEYVAAMANAPKKYLISKRHLLKAQFGPKSRSGWPKSPNVHQTDATENDGTSPPGAVSPSVEELNPLNVDGIANSYAFESVDVDSGLLGGDSSPFDDEMSLFNGNLSIDKDNIGSKIDEATRVQDVAVDEHTDFSFLDGEADEPESPKFLVVESSKDLHETHSAGGIESSNEDAESLAIENFEEPDDDEDLDVSPMHTESKAEELSINYGDLMSSEEADAEELSCNAVEPTATSQTGDEDATVTEAIDNPLPTMDCENGGRESTQAGVKLPATDCDQDAGNNQESILPPTAITEQAVEICCVDESMPILDSKQLEDDNNGGCFDAGQIVDDEKNGDLDTVNASDIAHDNLEGSGTDSGIEHSGDLVSLSVADEQRDYPPLHDVDNDLCGITTSCNGKHVDGDLVSLSVADEQRDYHSPLHEVDNELSGVTTSCNGKYVDGDLVSLSVADKERDYHPPLHVVDNDLCGVTTSCNGKHVDGNEGGITSLHGAENEQSNDDISSIHDNEHVEYEDQSDEDESEDDEPDAKLRGTLSTEENECIDALEGKEDTLDERVGKDQDVGNMSSNSTRRQRRRRVLRVMEDVSPETVILRKQQTQGRKQAEEWMLNHAIEGVVHKLAPTGDAKVKILVEAFESIISHTDTEIIDSHNTRQEKRVTT